MEITAQSERGRALATGTIILLLTSSAIGNKKRVSTDIVETDADKGSLSLHKKIMEAPEFQACLSHIAGTRDNITKRSLPSFLQRGAYLVKLEAAPLLETYLANAQENLLSLVDGMINAMPQIKEEARVRLGSLYSDADYPGEQDIRRHINMAWRWFEIDTPDRLRSIDMMLFEKEREKAARAFEEAVDGLTVLLRDEFRKVVAHLADRLAPDADGKKKKLFGSAVENVTEFLELFALRNVTGDEELSSLVEMTKSLMEGVDPKFIRKDDDYRASVQEDVERVLDEIDALPVIKVSRAISFSDDDE